MEGNPITQAIEAVGGQKPLADAIGVHPSLISQWRSGHRPVSAERCRAIEAATGVSRYALRPDVFGPAPDPEARDAA